MQQQPSQISPSESFDLFYFLRNPTDNNTYYVQAVLYDLRTGAVLLTTPLAQAATNAHLFVATVQAPPDVTAHIGRNIVAIASVYTDSGYTTKSDAYEEQEQYFLVKSPPLLLSGGGGMDVVTYKEIVADAVEAKFKTLKIGALFDAINALPFDSLFGTLGAITKEINRIPKDATDLSTVLQAIKDARVVLDAIASKAEPEEPEKVDLTPVIAAINDAKDTLISSDAELHSALTQLPNPIIEGLQRLMDTLEQRMTETVVKTIESAEMVIPVTRSIPKAPAQPAPQRSPIDVSHLTN